MAKSHEYSAVTKKYDRSDKRVQISIPFALLRETIHALSIEEKRALFAMLDAELAAVEAEEVSEEEEAAVRAALTDMAKGDHVSIEDYAAKHHITLP